MHGGEDQSGEWRAPGGPPGPVGPPTAWPDGTPAGGPQPPPAGPPVWAPPVWAPPVWGPPPLGGPSLGGPSFGGPWRPPVPPSAPAPRPPKGRAVLAVLGVVAAVVAVAAAVVMADPMGVRSDETAVGWRDDAPAEDLGPVEDRPSAQVPTPSTTTTQPPTTTTAPPVRLAPVPAPPAEPGFHTFLGREDDGDPIVWDPCETIQYVVNSRLAPAGAPEVLAEALAQVTAATGLVFEDRGATDEPPSAGRRPLEDQARYGEGWSPVLIAWTDPTEAPDLEGWVAGYAGPDWVPSGRGGEYESVTGTVYLDGPDAAGLIDDGYRTDLVQIVMHELGHLVGLGHVEDTREVMYHNTDGRGEFDAVWNDGDRAGLVTAGSGDCDPDT